MDAPQWFYLSLDRAVAVTLSCGAIGAVGFALLSSVPRPASRWELWTAFIGMTALSMGGMLLMSFAASRLRDAVQNGRWPEEAAETWRQRISVPWWKALLIVTSLSVLLGALSGFRHNSFRNGHFLLYWPSFIVAQTLSQVSTAFRKPAAGSFGTPPLWRDWRNFGKLKSDHWGEH